VFRYQACNGRKKNFLTEKLVVVLHRCQLSVRDAIFVIEVVAEVLVHDIDDFVINRSSIYEYHTILGKNI